MGCGASSPPASPEDAESKNSQQINGKAADSEKPRETEGNKSSLKRQMEQNKEIDDEYDALQAGSKAAAKRTKNPFEKAQKEEDKWANEEHKKNKDSSSVSVDNKGDVKPERRPESTSLDETKRESVQDSNINKRRQTEEKKKPKKQERKGKNETSEQNNEALRNALLKDMEEIDNEILIETKLKENAQLAEAAGFDPDKFKRANQGKTTAVASAESPLSNYKPAGRKEVAGVSHVAHSLGLEEPADKYEYNRPAVDKGRDRVGDWSPQNKKSSFFDDDDMQGFDNNKIDSPVPNPGHLEFGVGGEDPLIDAEDEMLMDAILAEQEEVGAM
mmetsp:Transcript_5697/g.8836  ORF Transcript_5697/g.8836 Transcript_5697/m.8836 type:complete len:331 (-) Transcript_5697:14-1006(-)